MTRRLCIAAVALASLLLTGCAVTGPITDKAESPESCSQKQLVYYGNNVWVEGAVCTPAYWRIKVDGIWLDVTPEQYAAVKVGETWKG